MGVFDALSALSGKLPPIHEINELLSEEKVKRLTRVLARLERLSKNDGQLKDGIELLRLVKQLDDSGGLARLDDILKELGPLVKGKEAKEMLGRLDGLQGMLGKLLSG